MGAEWAIRQQGSVQASLTLRKQRKNNRGKVPLPTDAPPPTQTPTGQPCSTGVGNNPLTIKKPSQRAVSRMPKARRSRLSLTRCAGCATLPRYTKALECVSSGTIRRPKWILRQFKEETRRLSSAKSRVDDAEMAQKTPKLRIREFLRHALIYHHSAHL